MPPRRRSFKRPYGERRYRKLFILAVEGGKTEPEYFKFFNDQNSFIHIKCLKGEHESSPPQVLKRMRKHLESVGLKKSDEAWLVVDRDQWNDDQLTQLYAWSQEQDNYGFALSNPKFEYWLLLHFENGDAVTSSRSCSERLSNYLPEYDKGIDMRRFTSDMINEAIQRARNRDAPPCTDWPRNTGTTVYRLVDSIQMFRLHSILT